MLLLIGLGLCLGRYAALTSIDKRIFRDTTLKMVDNLISAPETRSGVVTNNISFFSYDEIHPFLIMSI